MEVASVTYYTKQVPIRVADVNICVVRSATTEKYIKAAEKFEVYTKYVGSRVWKV